MPIRYPIQKIIRVPQHHLRAKFLVITRFYKHPNSLSSKGPKFLQSWLRPSIRPINTTDVMSVCLTRNPFVRHAINLPDIEFVRHGIRLPDTDLSDLLILIKSILEPCRAAFVNRQLGMVIGQPRIGIVSSSRTFLRLDLILIFSRRIL